MVPLLIWRPFDLLVYSKEKFKIENFGFAVNRPFFQFIGFLMKKYKVEIFYFVVDRPFFRFIDSLDGVFKTDFFILLLFDRSFDLSIHDIEKNGMKILFPPLVYTFFFVI